MRGAFLGEFGEETGVEGGRAGSMGGCDGS